MKADSRVTKKQIAEQTGLSLSTIDRVLNNRGHVKPETYRRVMEACRELNYQVNRSASLLSRKRDIMIGVVLFTYPTFFWDQVERGVQKAYQELRDYGLQVEVMRIDNTPDVDVDRVQEVIDSGRFAGLALVASDDQFIGIIDRCIDTGFPVVTLNTDAPASKRLFYVGCNYTRAGRLAAELLCKFVGRKGKVTLITDSWTSFQSHQKIQGFREALAEYPHVRMVGPLKFELADAANTIQALADDLRNVDGIYVSSSELVRIAKLKQEINPDAVLIGHDMNPEIYAHLQSGTITAVICQDPEAQGYLTVTKLFHHIALSEDADGPEHITRLDVVVKENARFFI
ncbi:LacI family DNA-binding transcriptional regulator [Alicyclobacillus kakegawensis]|uniref:LacI family DNA-binding transcriptional regulator n=1 Tax=Alicyclobacillus kakegawensis TaxID=392012 RepID=UPI00082CA412|nr:LacI family DNA-binding transcriptional regulator [Alicyclobacillus kakegawensis]